MNGFDSHVAVQVNSMVDLDKVKEQLNAVGWKSFIIDHEFVTSLYIFDPNGIQLEFTCRAKDHDQIMEEDANKAHQELEQWTKETRNLKLDKFGNEALDLREKT